MPTKRELAPSGKEKGSNEPMHTIFCSLLSVSLLFHAVLGCCRHPSDDAEANDTSAISHLADDDCCETDGTKADGNGHHGPCKDSHCHASCNYLPAQKSQIEKSRSYETFDAACCSDAPRYWQPCGQNLAAFTRHVLQPPIRLHLYHQILLI
jgi:hypothetical protein